MDLVGGVGIPDDELSVLRGRDEMSAVRRPVHGVDLGEMALQGPLRLHGEARQGLDAVSGDIADCAQRVSIEVRVRVRAGGAVRNQARSRQTYGLCQRARPSSFLSCP